MIVNYFIGSPQRREGREVSEGFCFFGYDVLISRQGGLYRFFVFVIDYKAVIIDMVGNLKLTLNAVKQKISV